MKLKIGVGVAVCLLIVAQIVHSVKRSREEKAAAVAAAATAAVTIAPRANPAEVAEIDLAGPDGGAPVRLIRSGNTWTIASLHGAPADKAKVERFLDQLLRGDAKFVAGAGEAVPGAGLGADEGLRIGFKRLDASELPGLVLGLHPENSYDATYVKVSGDERVFLLDFDARGAIGLWRNHPDIVPDSRIWLATGVFSFDPRKVASLDVVYPDHQLLFDRIESGDWRFFGPPPGGKWSPEGLAEWLADLADFRILDAADPEWRSGLGLDNPSHRLTLTLDGGEVKGLSLAPDRADDGMWVESSDFPGRVFFLPAWRFKFYFQRLAGLFPEAVPAFHPDQARFIDFRRGGESVKLARRDGEWRAVAVPYPIRPGVVERLTRLLAAWRPEDCASFGDRAARPVYGGPLLEVTLADGEVLQYRLGGRHPIFPWRYVLVNGMTLLSVAEAEAGVMFPEFSEILVIPPSGEPAEPEPSDAKRQEAGEAEPKVEKAVR